MERDPPDLALTQRQLREAQAGDRAALAALLERYLPRVRAMVAARLGHGLAEFAEVDDLVQETFHDVLKDIDAAPHASDGHFVNWLARCVENNVRDQARRRLAQKRGGGFVRPFASLADSVLSESLFAGDEAPASQVARGREFEAQVERALLQLGERYREVIVLRVHGQMSFREIAEAMQLGSENTANVLFLRARARLHELIAPSRQ